MTRQKNLSRSKSVSYPVQSETIQNEIDRIVSHHLRKWTAPYEEIDTALPVLEPRIEIIDTDKQVEVTAELPGLDAQNIDINISTDGYLTITGEKKNETEQKSKGYYFSERAYGIISRSVPLPEGIDTEKADAEFDKGILKITLPKLPTAQEKIKKITVRSK